MGRMKKPTAPAANGDSALRRAQARKKAKAKAVEIKPGMVYSRLAAAEAVGIGENAISEEVRSGRLRAAIRCGRWLFIGEWLLSWIKEGPQPGKEDAEVIDERGGGDEAQQDCSGL